MSQRLGFRANQEKTALGPARAAGSAIDCHLKMACASVEGLRRPAWSHSPSSDFGDRPKHVPPEDREVQLGAKVLLRNIINIILVSK